AVLLLSLSISIPPFESRRTCKKSLGDGLPALPPCAAVGSASARGRCRLYRAAAVADQGSTATSSSGNARAQHLQWQGYEDQGPTWCADIEKGSREPCGRSSEHGRRTVIIIVIIVSITTSGRANEKANRGRWGARNRRWTP
ncbi:unnamed protein product, partial [Ectocarpus sp. 12 AP-2014]